jgi:hypothetical protein
VRRRTPNEPFALGREQDIGGSAACVYHGQHNPIQRSCTGPLLAGRPIVIPGDRDDVVQFTDARRALASRGRRDRPAYSGRYPYTQLDFVRLLARVSGTETDRARATRADSGDGGVLTLRTTSARTSTYHRSPSRRSRPLGADLELTPLEQGARPSGWVRAAGAAGPDFTWEDALLASAR